MTRILRYIGNRKEPEAELYGKVDWPIVKKIIPEPITYDPNDPKIPDVMQSGMKRDGDLFVPSNFSREIISFSQIFSRSMFSNAFVNMSPWYPDPPATPQPESVFETNMMEALVGWKTLSVEDGKLFSASRAGIEWLVDAPLVAECSKHKEAPFEHCTCGIYASDTRDGADSYSDDDEDVTALVYGWGKYVRGAGGWRTQFAYPKCFYLKHGQEELIEPLKAYHVPVYIEQPTLIYNPEEDGYEYRGEDADWNSRALEESFTSKERDSDDEED